MLIDKEAVIPSEADDVEAVKPAGADGSTGSQIQNDPAIPCPEEQQLLEQQPEPQQAKKPQQDDPRGLLDHEMIQALQGVQATTMQILKRLEISDQNVRNVKRQNHRGRLEDRKWVEQNQLRARRADRKWMQKRIRQALQTKKKMMQQVVEPIRLRIADIEQEVAVIKNGRRPRDRNRVRRPRRARGAARPATVEAEASSKPRRAHKPYTKKEQKKMVQYLIEKDKIRDAKSVGVWEGARGWDAMLRERSADGLRQHFTTRVWKDVMRGKHDVHPDILPQFRGIWPTKSFSDP